MVVVERRTTHSCGIRVTLLLDTLSPSCLMDLSVTRAYWKLSGKPRNTSFRFTFSI